MAFNPRSRKASSGIFARLADHLSRCALDRLLQPFGELFRGQTWLDRRKNPRANGSRLMLQRTARPVDAGVESDGLAGDPEGIV